MNFISNELLYIISSQNISDIFDISDNEMISIEEFKNDFKYKEDEVKFFIKLA